MVYYFYHFYYFSISICFESEERVPMKRLSVITISYNSEDTIRSTMLSVLKQKYRPLQYVLIDGSSKDKTNEIIRELLPEFNNAGIDIVTVSEPDRGISDAFNKGISLSTGDVIGIINSGDSYEENALEKVMQQDWDNIDLLCGDILWIDSANKIEYIRRSSTDWSRLRLEMTVMHPSCFVKKAVYDECGMFDISFRYTMDYDLVCRFHRMNKKLVYIPLTIADVAAGGISDDDIDRTKNEIFSINRLNNVNALYSRLHWKWVKCRRFLAAKLKKKKLFFKK